MTIPEYFVAGRSPVLQYKACEVDVAPEIFVISNRKRPVLVATTIESEVPTQAFATVG